jgi:toxin ParE1/3/4
LKLRWLPGAAQEVEDTVEYLERQQIALGDNFADILRESLARIIAQPDFFSPLETLPADSGYRRLIMPKFSYLVIYRQTADHIVIAAVAHTSRLPNYWLDRDAGRGT